MIKDVMEGNDIKIAPRTLRQRFLKTAGLSQERIFQIQRAEKARAMLNNGVSINDVVFELEYFDQPHLNRNMQKYFGKPPSLLKK